ncbi:MAG: hypothetical protein WCL16_01265 [bacterium]
MSDAATNVNEIAIGAPPGLAPGSAQQSGVSKKVAVLFAMLALVATLVFAVLLGTMWADWTYY